MALDPDGVEAVTFDSYSTLLDVATTATALAEHVDDPAGAARTWRIHSLVYAQACNALETYEPFSTLLEYALEYALAEQGVTLSADAFEEVLSIYHDLDAFADVRPGVERLVDAGYDCYVVSNGDEAMLDSLLTVADIEGLIADTVSADSVESYKPAPPIYREAVRRIGSDPDEIAHATAALLDVQGAKNVGVQGVWLNRHERPASRFYDDPDAGVSTVGELATALDA